jgi:hypothetical protein
MAKNSMLCVLGFLTSLSLSACSSNVPTSNPVIDTVPIKYQKPIVPSVDELSLRDTPWIVVTESNYSSVLARLRDEGKEPVLYALTSEGYVNQLYNKADIIKVIRQQQRVIAVYDNWQYWDECC